MNFTSRVIESLKKKEKRYELFDDKEVGFGIRVSPNGNKSWISRYRLNGKLVKYTHGRYPILSLSDANNKHKQLRIMLHDGKDPQAEKQIAKTSNIEAPNVEELVGLFIELYAKPNKRSWKSDEGRLQKYLVPKYGKVKAKDIKRQHISLLLDELVSNGMGVGANRVFAAIRKLFNWAVSKGILESSPCTQIKAPAKEKSRDRVLDSREIKRFWINLASTNLNRHFQLALMLMLVTAQRKSEVLQMSKTEVDLDNGWWVIPANKTKNGLQHRVPLSVLAAEIVDEAIKLAKESELVFPNLPCLDKPIRGDTVSHKLSDNRGKLDIQNFTPHDLRRTAASHMASVGVTRLIISKILNHVETSVTAVYDRHSYDSEKRIALSKWESCLLKIVEGKESSIIKFPSLG